MATYYKTCYLKILLFACSMIIFQIVAGWWRRQPGKAAVVGVSTDHSYKLINLKNALHQNYYVPFKKGYGNPL